MQYLAYHEYMGMGGTLDNAAFCNFERKASNLINSQASGQTGKRIGKLTELPQAIKNCVFDLIAYITENSTGVGQVSNASQSQGGISESYSYVTKTDDDIAAACVDIIYNNFYGAGIGNLLYRGLDYE